MSKSMCGWLTNLPEQFALPEKKLSTMTDNWNYDLPWYHGSQQELTLLRVGSSITQDREIARIFSHRPTISTV